ncbi:hypothetical protein Cs7R123_49150 [Catellatospora sp. TT07R-123]|uniref:HesA/MoeB/ThiF family protein n=1 Tax=Catellatospora sp. TT07R-123 TaxID=2733863 RepID=UPI001B07B175|nr:ThiF family adenylyltransferase [Catellatospora sp. TT07R-123]GHJ47573.1 hypothetical protein Cs7R123_49150 [Catellatospora sp. TT07R-123]
MSTPTPRIYLYQEQVNDLFQQFDAAGRADLAADALGMRLDGDDVFHVYTAKPRTHFSGTPCRATVRLADGAGHPPTQPSEQVPIAIDLSFVDGKVEATGSVVLASGPVEAAVHFVPVRTEIYSRNQGLLATDALAGRSVAVVGLGSGGSSIALALAQAGVGRMVLADRDRIEVANVARHACGIGDLGRRKTAAVADLLVGKNPDIQLSTVDVDVLTDTSRLTEALAGVDLIIAATDSDRSRFVLNQVALELDVTTLFGRVLSRASGGEVLRVRPSAGPCLACVYTERFLASRPREYATIEDARADAPAYVDEADLEATVMVGLASDIAPVSNMMVKLALVELSRGTRGELTSLDEDLGADFYLWANRREGVYSGWPVMGHAFNTPAVLRWYGAPVQRQADCAVCSLPGAGTAVNPILLAG